MNKLRYLFIPLVALFACNDDITIQTDDLMITIDENPSPGQLLGTIPATTNQGAVQFTLTSENPVGAFNVDSFDGSLFVADPSLFDFETNPTLTAEVTVSNSGVSEISNVTVTLNDVDEGSIGDGTVWTGETITFTKPDGANPNLEQNQDRITDNVWITRADTAGIFNIRAETSYTKFSSPADTEWAFGTTANIGSLVFESWERTHGSSPPSMLDRDMVVHLISDNIFIDIKFTSWSCCGAGGFSYTRSTE